MCGILGASFFAPENLRKANKLLMHRGSDDEGYFEENSVSLAHNRLSILDLSPAGHQPMFYSPNSGACSAKFYPDKMQQAEVGIVYNGEIYNFEELKISLSEKNYVFKSNSDTELILAAYMEWGMECVHKFNGMWAFCIYDKRNNSLFLSRDRLGIKPLYYYFGEGKFMFASELKALFELGMNFEINKNSLHHYLIFGYTDTKNSIIKDVQKILPGESILFHLNTQKILKKEKYWEPQFTSNKDYKQSISKNIYNLLEDAVIKRLRSDVPLGAFLSGGIDSSIIVYFMKRHLPELNTFSVKFDKNRLNESAYAAVVAKKFNTIHHEVEFTAKDVETLSAKLPYFYDEPFGDESMIPTYLVSKVAANYVKVVLSGTGSDEIFGGYPRYNKYLWLAKINRLPNVIKQYIAFNFQLINKNDAQKLKLLFLSGTEAELYSKIISYLSSGNNDSFYSLDKFKHIENFFLPKETLNKALSFDQNYYLPSDLLVKEDRATMANTIEGRLPFLDFRLVEYANSIPVNYKIRFFTNKYILKETFKHVLPNQIIYRKKQGFGVPLAEYFRSELKDFAYKAIFDFSDFDYYDKKEVKQFWNLHQQSSVDYSSYFWKIINFNQWHKLWSTYKK